MPWTIYAVIRGMNLVVKLSNCRQLSLTNGQMSNCVLNAFIRFGNSCSVDLLELSKKCIPSKMPEMACSEA